MDFGFDARTRELLSGIAALGSISAAAARLGMDPANACRHLRTAERRASARLVERHRGGRGFNARLTREGRSLLATTGRLGLALEYDADQGVTRVRLGGRILLAAGRLAPGPVAIRLRPESVALQRPTRRPSATSVRNRIRARVHAVHPHGEGVFRVELTAGALRLESLVVRGALRDLRLRPGSVVDATLKASSLEAIS